MSFQTWSMLLLFLLFSQKSMIATPLNTDETRLSGKITDAITGESLAGASIYLPDMKIGAVTYPDGSYQLGHLPKRVVTIQVSLLGYRQIVEKIDLNEVSVKNFALQTSVTEVNEVVITGTAQSVEQNRTPTPIVVVGHQKLQQITSTNLINALTGQPGISAISTGAGISKPVIRGLGYNRVVVVNDGIRQEGQQWGDEHGIEIDEFSVHKVEILKGPASLLYGSDAMAGVLNMLSAPTLPDGKMAVNLHANYQTNNGLRSFSGNFTGTRRGLIWDLRASQKAAHSYQNRLDGPVFNSGFREKAAGGIVGLNKSWGYSHLHFSAYSLRPGIVEGERDSLTGLFLKPVALNSAVETLELATENDFKSYSRQIPFQKIHHFKAVLNNSFVAGESTLKATLGFQQNRRQEFDDVLNPAQFGLFFLLNTVNYGLQFNFRERKNLHFSVGANGMWQSSKNEGTEFLVPEYDLFDAGIFAIAKKSVGKLDISGGLRFDWRTEQTTDLFLNADGEKVAAPGPGILHRFEAFDGVFSGSSGSLGATYQFSEKWFGKLNFSRGFRAPNIAELGANGVHEGTIRYEIGDPNLKPETSWQGDLAVGMQTEHVTAEFDLFDNRIQNFIFSRKLVAANGQDSLSEDLRTFQFGAGDAHLFGGEFSLDFHPHPLDWLHVENSFSWVGAVQRNQPDSTRFLPLTPGPKWSVELRADLKKWEKWLQNGWFRVRFDHYFAQNHFFSAFETETKTPGYSLLEMGLGADLVRKNRKFCSLILTVNNLTDAVFQNHLSRLKYASPNLVTSRTGVFDMGRNFSFKLLVPLSF